MRTAIQNENFEGKSGEIQTNIQMRNLKVEVETSFFSWGG